MLTELAASGPAERAGWDGVFFEDYLVYYRGEDPAAFDPSSVMAVIAAGTSHITLGTTVTGLLARDPDDRGAALNPLWDAGRSRGVQMDERLDLLMRLLAAAVVADRTGTGRPASAEVAVGGRTRLPSEAAERAAIDAAARGGATWWLEFVHAGADAAMLAAVRRGPVRPTPEH